VCTEDRGIDAMLNAVCVFTSNWNEQIELQVAQGES